MGVISRGGVQTLAKVQEEVSQVIVIQVFKDSFDETHEFRPRHSQLDVVLATVLAVQ